jgi:hypothetical protein
VRKKRRRVTVGTWDRRTLVTSMESKIGWSSTTKIVWRVVDKRARLHEMGSTANERSGRSTVIPTVWTTRSPREAVTA